MRKNTKTMLTPKEYETRLAAIQTEIKNLQEEARQAIEARQKQLGMSLSQLADHANMSKSFLHRIIRGEKPVPLTKFYDIMQYDPKTSATNTRATRPR